MADEYKKTRFTYPLRDSINDKIDAKRAAIHSFDNEGDNKALEEDIHVFQQSFLGLSIMDFSSSLGFNSDASSLTLNLVKDEVNYLTALRPSGLRDAVTEGYHPWDTKAFPKPLIQGATGGTGAGCSEGGVNTERAAKAEKDEPERCVAKPGVIEDECIGIYEDEVNCNENPNCYWTKKYDLAHEMGLTFQQKGDIECFPAPGSPVFFKYYDGKLLTEECITADPGTKEFCKNVYSFNGILSKWEKQYSTSGFTYSVNITDPREILENTIVILDGISNRVQPADTHIIKDSTRSYEEGWNGYYNIVNVFGYYEIHGFGASDRTDLGMKWFDKREPVTKNEETGFPSQYLGRSASTVNENEDGDQEEVPGDKVKNHHYGVLPALRLILSGRNSKYIEDQEPFGGPIYYGIDNRNIEAHAPFSEGEIKNETKDVETVDPEHTTLKEFNIHRYIIDLDDLVKLTEDEDEEATTDSLLSSSEDAPAKTAELNTLPSDFHIEGDRPSLLQIITQVCDAAGVAFQVKLLSLEEADLSSKEYAPWADKSKYIDQVRNYSGVIKIIPLIKKLAKNSDTIIRKHIDDSQTIPKATGAFTTGGISRLISASVGREFVDPIAGQILFGAPRTRVVGVTPLGDKKIRRELWFNNQTQKYNDNGNLVGECYNKSDGQPTGDESRDACLADKDGGPSFCKNKPGIIEDECIGVYEDAVNCTENPNCYWTEGGKSLNRWVIDELNNAPIEGRDDILHEFIPSIEIDGVTLLRQRTPKDEFPDRDGRGWNPYGPESRKELDKKRDPSGVDKEELKDFEISKDFGKNLPPVSNDDYLPWIYPEDYSGQGGKEADPFQLNRANSRHHEISGECDQKYCDKKADHDACLDENNQGTGDVDQASCDKRKEEGQDVTWITSGSAIKTKGVCSYYAGSWAKHSDDKEGCEGIGSFTKEFQESLSGYLDIFPCWGFKEKLFTPLNEEKKLLFDDIIDIKQQGKPIKGFFWDDDPYRDFHPTEGIFGSFEFYNPGLGECAVVRSDAAVGGIEAGDVIGEFENKADICECDPNTSPPDSDCVTEWGAAGNPGGGDWEQNGFKAQWRPYCIASFECRDSDGGLIDELHSGAAGTGAKDKDGNNLTDNPYTCTQGCFELSVGCSVGDPATQKAITTERECIAADGEWIENNPTGKAIVAYYTKSVQLSPGVFEQGDRADINDSNFAKNVQDGIVKFMGGADECIASGKNRKAIDNEGPDGGDLPDLIRGSAPINAAGELAEEGKGNSHKQFGGAYDKKCKAINFKFPWSACCKATSDITVGDKEYKKDSCTDVNNIDDCDSVTGAKWATVPMFAPDMVDDFTGQTIESKDIPKPGYINVRHKVEGSCKRTVELEDGETKEEPLEINVTDPNDTRTVEQACIEEGGEMNLEAQDGVFMPLHPRTATIPIDLSIIGYEGGPTAETNGPDEFKGFYYATVTELRHAAVSQDSWLNYMREIQPFLACKMFAQNKSDVSKWKDYCSTVIRTIFKGGKSNAHIYAQSTLQNYGDAKQAGKITAAALAHGGRPNHEDALALQGHICGDDPSNATLSIGQKTTMEVDLAYKKIREIATQFYGRKYLVPLPFNPPTAILCTNPEHKEKATCEEAGFDWGSHGLISAWFRTFGFGSCVDAGGIANTTFDADKQTCEEEGLAWIEPVQEANKWNIVSAGWPGGDVSVVFDKGRDGSKMTGYPENMNFWTDDGNLKSFVIFPEKDRRRFAGDAGENERLNFSAWDAEQVHISSQSNSAADEAGVDYGAKTFASAEVDPKTHWLNTRPDWEIQQEKQYYKFRAGDPTNAKGFPEDSTDDSDEDGKDVKGTLFLTVGPEPIIGMTCNGGDDGTVPLPYYSPADCAKYGGTWEKDDLAEFDLQQKLNARDVFIFKPDVFECKKAKSSEAITYICVDAEGKPKPEVTDESSCKAPDKWTSITEELCTGEGGVSEGKWEAIEQERIEYAAYKPYALITLPSQVYYGNIDRARELSKPLGGNTNDVCIPLISGRGRSALLNAWLQGMSPKNISVQQLVGIANIDKANAIVAPDTSRSDFISAVYKPWHAAIPQQSTVYRWGPWAGGVGFGRPDFQVDEQMHPAAFNGETKLSQIAISRLQAIVRKNQAHIETGSVTVVGFSTEEQGFCRDGIDAWTKDTCEDLGSEAEWENSGKAYVSSTSGPNLGDSLLTVGPFITSIDVQIGAGGIQVTYGLSTQKKFGELEKLQENRIRQAQKDITRARIEGEKQLLRVKRGIDQFKR